MTLYTLEEQGLIFFLVYFLFWKPYVFSQLLTSVTKKIHLERMELHGSLKKSIASSERELSFMISVKLAKNNKKCRSTWSCAVSCSKMRGVTQLLFRIQSCYRYLGDPAMLFQGIKVHDRNFLKKNFYVPLLFSHHKIYNSCFQ